MEMRFKLKLILSEEDFERYWGVTSINGISLGSCLRIMDEMAEDIHKKLKTNDLGFFIYHEDADDSDLPEWDVRYKWRGLWNHRKTRTFEDY